MDAVTGAGCGLLVCDVDGLQQVDDGRGHAVGDQLLAELARRMRRVPGRGRSRSAGRGRFRADDPGVVTANPRDLVRRLEAESARRSKRVLVRRRST
ncbi:diguanylate cyclase domain-containing protein [Blastococcus sp. TF02A-26]|uniref:diguanylate cyclase domain-containing protein n=1 Tax=Blastococcus sp. TF02A-26 TaxID=2250577 RepID=UPI000DE9AC6C|nr:hypothetical protein DQ240_23010 [Blastococcus sp. TF02A-26]